MLETEKEAGLLDSVTYEKFCKVSRQQRETLLEFFFAAKTKEKPLWAMVHQRKAIHS